MWSGKANEALLKVWIRVSYVIARVFSHSVPDCGFSGNCKHGWNAHLELSSRPGHGEGKRAWGILFACCVSITRKSGNLALQYHCQ